VWASWRGAGPVRGADPVSGSVVTAGVDDGLVVGVADTLELVSPVS
jgi:hypothetical protein